MELITEEINIRTWERREAYLYFTKMNPSAYSLTADIDVTNSVQYCRENGLSYFALCLWIVSKAVNEIPEFRFSYKEKKLVRFNHVLPMFPVFHEDSKTCTMVCADTCQDFEGYLAEFNEQVGKAKLSKRFITGKFTVPPANVFSVSMEPRIHFNNCSLVHAFNADKPVFSPIIVMGKYELQLGKYQMPVAIQVNHAIADGYQSGLFYKRIGEMFSDPAGCLK